MSVKDRTRQCIIDAFNDLISRKNFNSITVSMICSKADIGRATFYRHFKDKYAVMNENYSTLLTKCAADQAADALYECMPPTIRDYRVKP